MVKESSAESIIDEQYSFIFLLFFVSCAYSGDYYSYYSICWTYKNKRSFSYVSPHNRYNSHFSSFYNPFQIFKKYGSLIWIRHKLISIAICSLIL